LPYRQPQPSADASCSELWSAKAASGEFTSPDCSAAAGADKVAGRALCATGCVILWRGRTLLSRAVELFTPFSHCSLVVRMDEYLGARDRVTCVEAVPGGLQPRLLSALMRAFKGEIYLFAPEGLTPERQAMIRAFALGECLAGKGYDYIGFLMNILGRPRERRDRYFCSEFCAVALDKSGIARRGCHKGRQAASCSSLSSKVEDGGRGRLWSDEARVSGLCPETCDAGEARIRSKAAFGEFTSPNCNAAAGADKVPLSPRPGDIPKWWPGSMYRLVEPFTHKEAICRL